MTKCLILIIMLTLIKFVSFVKYLFFFSTENEGSKSKWYVCSNTYDYHDTHTHTFIPRYRQIEVLPNAVFKVAKYLPSGTCGLSSVQPELKLKADLQDKKRPSLLLEISQYNFSIYLHKMHISNTSHIFTYLKLYMDIYTHTHTHIYIYIYIYTHTCTRLSQYFKHLQIIFVTMLTG